MPLRQAHELVTDLEAEMRREVPAIPPSSPTSRASPPPSSGPPRWSATANSNFACAALPQHFPEILDIHDVFVTRRGRAPSTSPTHLRGLPQRLRRPLRNRPDHIQVSCHCTLPDDLPMARVHAVITALEGAFKLDAPEVDRLLIHPEPATDNRR